MSTRTRALTLPAIDYRLPVMIFAALALLASTTLMAGCKADAGAEDDAVDIAGE